MTSSQKVIKGFAIALAVIIIVSVINLVFGIIVGFDNIFIKNENVTYETYELTDFDNLNINVSYSKINIKNGDTYKIEINNLTNYHISNDTLYIKDVKKFRVTNNNDIYVTLYIPYGKTFDDVSIDAGAGNIRIENLKADTLDLDMGAGKVTIENIEISSNTKVDGGAGNFEVQNGILADATFKMGVVNVDINATINGRGKIDMGVGNLSLNLLDGVSNYKFDVNKGIGNVNIDGVRVGDGSYGNGDKLISIDGGVGNINIH